MPPVGKPLKNDGPACRVCGCTEHNACVIRSDETFVEGLAKAVRIPPTRMPRLLTCSWAKTEASTPPLCSACSGTDADLAEVTGRMLRYMRQHGEAAHKLTVAAGLAALQRYRARLKLST